MKKILFFAALFLFSCAPQKGIAPIDEGAVLRTEDGREIAERIEEKEEEAPFEEVIEADTDAEINIISQIPQNCFVFWDEKDLIELKIRRTTPRSLLVEVPQNFFFNSIQTASEISAFAKKNPACARGIFGDVQGITEVANGTQKVIFGLIPRTAKSLEFRFELPVSDTAKMINELVWRYNARFIAQISDEQTSMERRPNFEDGSKIISYRFMKNGDELISAGTNEERTMLLFRRRDLAYVRGNLRWFRISEFANLRVSAFINPVLDFETKETLANILQNTDIYRRAEYDLQVLPPQSQARNAANIRIFDRDTIRIIYDADNPIAFETAMTMSDELRRRTRKRVVAFADAQQQKLFFFDFDVAVGVYAQNTNEAFLSRKFLGRDFSEDELEKLRLKTDLFEMKTYLCSPQRIIAGQRIISRLEAAK